MRPRGGVTCYARTESGVDAFAARRDAAGRPVERLLTPLEALHIFRAQETTPTAALREDHFEREAALVRGQADHREVAAGNLRASASGRSSGSAARSSSRRGRARSTAMMDAPTDRARQHPTAQARRSKYADQDLADLVKQLHDEDRLVIGSDREGRDQDRVLDRGDGPMSQDLVAKAETRDFDELFRLDLNWGAPDHAADRSRARRRHGTSPPPTSLPTRASRVGGSSASRVCARGATRPA